MRYALLVRVLLLAVAIAVLLGGAHKVIPAGFSGGRW
jgi:hypothetical protein